MKIDIDGKILQYNNGVKLSEIADSIWCKSWKDTCKGEW